MDWHNQPIKNMEKLSFDVDDENLLSTPNSENKVKRTNSLMDFVLKSPRFNQSLKKTASFRFGAEKIS